MTMKPISRILILLFLLVNIIYFLPGCSESNRANDAQVNTVVLVTLDTWRWDASGFLGQLDPSPTPFLDELAAGGLVAVNAVTPIPNTGPSHWSMMTGAWPWRDGVRVNGDKPATGNREVLAGQLKESGFRTAAFVSCRVLDQRAGFGRGFDHFDDRVSVSGAVDWSGMPERRGDRTVQSALDWVKNQTQKEDKLFIWLHLFDPHYPYNAPTGHFAGYHPAYLGEVAYVDGLLRTFSGSMAVLNRPLDQSLWVVISDHGEALGAHGEETHGLMLHSVTTRIPLLIHGPGVGAETYRAPASTVDLFPTILGYLGKKPGKKDGIDLLTGPGNLSRPIPMETMMGARGFGIAAVTGLRQDKWLWEASPGDYLWNLEEDPGETQNIAFKHKKIIKQVKQTRARFDVPGETTSNKVDASLMKDIQSLGYVTGNMKAGKDSVREFVLTGGKWFQQALTLQKKRDYKGADALLVKFLERYPNSPNMWQKAGMVAVQMKNFELAEKRFKQSRDLEPTPAAHLNLANVYYFKKRFSEAEAEYRKVLVLDKKDLFALYNLGNLLTGQNRMAEALPFWEEFINHYPNHPNAPAVRQRIAQIKNQPVK